MPFPEMPPVGVHGLRSLAYHLQIPEQIAMEIGGWSDIGTMRKIYTHIAQQDMERYKTKLQDFFKKCKLRCKLKINPLRRNAFSAHTTGSSPVTRTIKRNPTAAMVVGFFFALQ